MSLLEEIQAETFGPKRPFNHIKILWLKMKHCQAFTKKSR